MAAQEVTAFTALVAAPASGDLFIVVDVSDTTDSANGTTKKVEGQYLVDMVQADWSDELAQFTGIGIGKVGATDKIMFANEATIDVDGADLNIDCGAGYTAELTHPVYEDLQVSISNIRVPTSNAPTERLYAAGIGSGVTFPFLGFAVNDYIYFDVQTSHSMKLNTVLDNHLHYTLPNTTDIADNFKFQLDVIAAGINTAWAVPTGSPFTAEKAVAANDDTYHRLFQMADIPASNDTVSTIYKCKLTRIAASADEYGSEVYLTFTDCHYQKDTMGSRQEDSK